MKRNYISFVIPAKNEEGSLAILFQRIKESFRKIKYPFEVIFVDDGSTDRTLEIMNKIRTKDKRAKIISLRGNFGKSIALRSGFEHAKGNIIITMDADLQDDPVEIPRFLKKIEEGYDLVSGWKKVRHDPPSKVIPSRILNRIITFATGLTIHDTNCGYKAYTKECVQNLNLYGELYRFIPVIAAKQNFKITEIIVKHHKRKYGKSKFGVGRNIKGFLDLITIIFLTGFIRRPGHFFGTIGVGLFSGGFLIGIYIAYLRLTTGTIQFRYPLLFLGILLMTVGIQFISTGLIAELITNFNFEAKTTKNYIKKINL